MKIRATWSVRMQRSVEKKNTPKKNPILDKKKDATFPDSLTRKRMSDAQIRVVEETILQEQHEHHSTIEEKNAKSR